MTRLYEAQTLQVGSQIQLSARAGHYLLTVLRAKVGDNLTLFNGQGGEYRATITVIAKKHVQVLLNEFIDADLESPLAIHLVQGLPKADKMDWIVQKAVELGVTSITPIITERTQGRLSKEQAEKKQERLVDIAISACEQCGRNRLPIIHPAIAFNEWLMLTKEYSHQYILTPTTETSLPSETKQPPTSICLLIGPEGGFTTQEVLLATQKGCKPLSLGKRILRTETASIAAISMMQAQFGDLKMIL